MPRFAPLLGIALVVLGAALYLPAAGGPPLMDEGERLAGLSAGTPGDAAVHRDAPDEFRPAANLATHALLALGGEAVSIRIAAAVLHGLSALILFLLVRRLVGADDEGAAPATLFAPAAAAVLFAVHPLGSEAILAHAAFPTVLATLLAMSSLLLAARAGDDEGGVRLFASASFYLAGLLADASIWPVGLLAASLARGTGVQGTAMPAPAWRRHLPYAVSLGLFYAGWMARTWPGLSPFPLHRPWSPGAGLASQAAAFCLELKLLVLPIGLSLDHGTPALGGTWNLQAIAGAGLLAGFLLAGLALGRRRGAASLAIGWYSLLHLHALLAPPEDPLAERRVYAVTIAFGLAAAAAGRDLERRGAGRAALAGTAIVSMLLALGTVGRVALWRDPEALWRAASEVNPVSPRPQIALANLAASRGDLDGALQSFEAAVARSPRSAPIQGGVAEIYFRKGDYQRALQEVDKAMSLDPSYFPAYITAGNAFMMRNQPRDAFLAFNAALRLRPEDPSALFNMGVLLFEQNRFGKSAEFLQKASAARPRDAEILFRLGMARLNTSDLPGAAEALRGCLAEAPDRVDAKLNLGTVMTQMKHFEEAGQILSGILAADPENAKALNGLAVLASVQDRWDVARDLFEKAWSADPNDLRVLYNLAGAYERLGDRPKAIESYRKFTAEWKGSLDASEEARARLNALEARPAR
ncbi:MAG: tetratricopeptide repeat protein [Acidobacteria bacterium]|nr:tetratricopeptide repeat protein [Acidobacteriota bacterium]